MFHMILNQLFKKYYNQISAALLPECKRALGKIYIRDIEKVLDNLAEEDENERAKQHVTGILNSFQTRYQVVFRPMQLPESNLEKDIKADINREWSGFFRTASVLVDNHNFYKAIERQLQRKLNGIQHAAKLLAQEMLLAMEIQRLYKDALASGQSKEALVQNLNFFSDDVLSPIFRDFYAAIKAYRDDTESYTSQTPENIQQAVSQLSSQVEELIAKEQALQSQRDSLFLGYRLRVSKELDPLCDRLVLFRMHSAKLRAEFITALVGFEREGSEELDYIQQILDKQLSALIDEIRAMRAVDIANEKAHTSIQDCRLINQLRFFKEEAETKQQSTLRMLSDSIYDIRSFADVRETINVIADDFSHQIDQLARIEAQYLKLKRKTIENIQDSSNFSLQVLDDAIRNVDEFFIAESTFELIVQKLNRYDSEDTRDKVFSGIQQNAIFTVDNLGRPADEPITLPHSIQESDLLSQLSQKAVALGIDTTVGFIPVDIDDIDSDSIDHILFFCKVPQKARPEIVGILKTEKQGNLLYIRKLAGILPLPTNVFAPLLDSYKSAYRSNAKQVSALASDDFLSNKLRVDFQGDIAKSMAQKKQQLKLAYLEELRKAMFEQIENDAIINNSFLKTVDSLIVETFDTLILGEDEKPAVW